MPKNRWGGASGSSTPKTGRLGRTARRAAGWADARTGRRASTAWKAARGAGGFRSGRRAAREALRQRANHKPIATGFVAFGAGVASMFSGWRDRARGWADQHMDTVDPNTRRGGPVPGHPGAYYADPHDNRPGYVDREGLGSDHPGYTTGHYDTNVDPRTWEQRVSNTHTGGNTMPGLPAATTAAQMVADMSRYEPSDAYRVVAESRQWADVPGHVALSVKAYVDRLEAARFPINPAINSKLLEFARAIAAAKSVAEEIEPLMRKAHADDLARRENPRGDERKWNV
ncbi:hypothetical protein [Nocardiopsis lucentensis]|uniref:hypothetical protein n=1 Tax=Nocardiopsis lucentensis TaxID=53441 RepID=UPI00034995F3|nr:hypothetical protein [Nocardiopsis lucentensis]